jgi:hypothetical protein
VHGPTVTFPKLEVLELLARIDQPAGLRVLSLPQRVLFPELLNGGEGLYMAHGDAGAVGGNDEDVG